MKTTFTKITIRELTENYHDDGDNGVFGYNNKLVIRPAYQREFVYKDEKRNLVIDSVMHDFPLNVMYWNKNGDVYEVLDGQQRTISICKYVNKEFSIKVNGNDKFFHNLSTDEQNQILDYELIVYICEGTESEKLDWFKRINIAGEVLTKQELLNATYAGSWLEDAKRFFSKRNCVAAQLSDGYLKGNPIRQDLLETALDWIADAQSMPNGEMYMAKHQHDEDANELWLYFQSVIYWAKMLYPNKMKGITDAQSWGTLYNEYRNKQYNSNELTASTKRLIDDDDVTNKKGIIKYLLSDRTCNDERALSIRVFTDTQKRRAYEKQGHCCAKCGREFAIEDMQGDHIIPWSKGGRTIDENLQMLCRECNATKSDTF